MIPEESLRRIAERHAYLEAAMAEPGADVAALSREYSDLSPVVDAIADHRRLEGELAEAEAMRADPELRALAEEEVARLRDALTASTRELRLALLPRDAADARPAILEIRPGTGGEEAALFAADLMRMYQRHADLRGWRFEVIEQSESDLGGLRELVARIAGAGVYARLKFEAGTHRVQRVPATESGGRIHTSAATVAVLPEAEEVDVRIDPNDLRIDTMRASGSGGQHVNTTDSAVRITHVPSGIVVTSSEKSQHRNREIAMQVLRARLFEAARAEADGARASDRRSMVGSGDRSERIRTYNFPQGRLTDHRIGLTLYRLEAILAGDLDEVTDALMAEAQARALSDLGV
ncbi:MAG: peptide chain release factor 1 [Paracoccaceae bacterium]